MDLAELLELLDRSDVRLDVHAGQLVLDGPVSIVDDTDVIADITENKSVLMAHVIGARTGHTIGACTRCSAVVLTHYRPVGARWPRCRLTPGCDGRHQPRQADVDRLAAAGAPAAPRHAKSIPNPPTRRLLGPRPTWPPRKDPR